MRKRPFSPSVRGGAAPSVRGGAARCTRVLGLVALALAVASCRATPRLFDGGKAYQHVLAQCRLGPRPVGSPEGLKTAEYIEAQLHNVGWTTQRQEFAFRGVSGQNVIASRGRGPLVILGAHYDTRPVADRDLEDTTRPVPGANDGASGVAVLLELARTLDVDKAGVEVWLAFFDAEDQGNLNGWPFSVGATYMAQHLTTQPRAVVVVDMIGDSDQQIFWESNSDEALLRKLWAVAAEQGYEVQFVPQYRYGLMDDHIPFRQAGLAAVDIIDFDYPYWHTAQDTPDKVSPDSLERVGRTLVKWLEEGQ